MSYEPTVWQDRIVERPRTYTVTNNPDGTITLTPAPGAVTQEGTPVNAAGLNNLETQYAEATAVALLKAGGTMTGDIDMGAHQVLNVVLGQTYAAGDTSLASSATTTNTGTYQTMRLMATITVTNGYGAFRLKFEIHTVVNWAVVDFFVHKNDVQIYTTMANSTTWYNRSVDIPDCKPGDVIKIYATSTETDGEIRNISMNIGTPIVIAPAASIVR